MNEISTSDVRVVLIVPSQSGVGMRKLKMRIDATKYAIYYLMCDHHTSILD
jgi:hypothetical protein